MNDIERLPWRVDRHLTQAIGPQQPTLEVCPMDAEASLPSLRCVFAQPAADNVSVLVRVHSRAGIPLASAPIDVNAGDSVRRRPCAARDGRLHAPQSTRAPAKSSGASGRAAPLRPVRPHDRRERLMLRPLTKAAVYNVARRTGRLRPRPLNLTFSVTYRCNAQVPARATSGRSASTT